MNYKTYCFFLFLALGCALFYNRSIQNHTAQIKPRLSIITSIYNGDYFIKEFLEDITQQTIFDQCELILVDANSPGDEEIVIRQYMRKYPNIIYLKLCQDPGLYSVWNRAIQMASSDLISNANLDDRSHPKALEIHVQKLEADPTIDLVYSDYLITDFPNETFVNNRATEHFQPPEFSKENMRYCLPGPKPVWRKSLHDRYGFFSEIFVSAGDHEMWLRAVSLGAKFKKIAGCYTLYYRNPRGLSTDADQRKAYQRMTENSLIYQKYAYLYGDELYAL